MPDEMVPEAAVGDVTASTSVAPEIATDAGSAPAPETPESPKPPEVDLASLLKDPALKKQLLSHPELRQEIDHRISSELGRRVKAADDLRAKAEERQRMLQANPTDLGRSVQERMRAEEELSRVAGEAYAGVAQEIFGTADKWPELTEDDKPALNPFQYKSLAEYIDTVSELRAKRMMEKTMPKLVQDEAQALLRQELGKIRGDNGPVNLPPASTPTFRTAQDVYTAYNEGKFGTIANPWGGQAKEAYARELRKFGLEP